MAQLNQIVPTFMKRQLPPLPENIVFYSDIC